jgi:DNA replication protein DnaC
MAKTKRPPTEPTPALPLPHTTGDDLVLARLKSHLAFLGLTHTAKSLDALLAVAVRERPGHTEWLEQVLAGEVTHKSAGRIARRILNSGLVESKTLEAFEWDFQPSLDRALVLELARLDFVRRHDDLVITGKSGTGKSHVLKALGLRACVHGISLRYARCVDLIADLHAGLADDTYPLRLKAWARPDLLIIDDVGLGQVRQRDDDPTAAHTLFNLIDRRHGRLSTAVSSNVDLREWGRFLGDNTVAAAILDRLAMHAIRIDIDGPSYRQHVATERAGAAATSAAPAYPPGSGPRIRGARLIRLTHSWAIDVQARPTAGASRASFQARGSSSSIRSRGQFAASFSRMSARYSHALMPSIRQLATSV